MANSLSTAPKRYHGVTLDDETTEHLRTLGTGNLSRGIRIAAHAVKNSERTPPETHVLTAHLADLWDVTPEEITLRALQHFQATVNVAEGMPTPPPEKLNPRSRHAARDAEIVRHVRNGVSRARIAANYGISIVRVHQILAIAKARGETIPTKLSRNKQLMAQGDEELRALAQEHLDGKSILEHQPKPKGKPLPFDDAELDDFLG